MAFNFSSLLNFSYSAVDKEVLLRFLLLKNIGRQRSAKLLFYLKKHELSVGNFMGIYKIFKNNKFLTNSYNFSNLEKQFYSIKKQLKSEKIIVIAFWEKEYPSLLRQTDDFPLVLFVKGNYQLLNSQAIAVVGTRKITNYGRIVTKKLVKELVGYNLTIVSGCMYGVDELAHEVALDYSAKTVAVLGYGFDYVFPSFVEPLQTRILLAGGCLVTEYLPFVRPSRTTFPQRNRVVAGLSLGTLVIEAGLKSGTHITVECALDAGREVFAVPGSIFNDYAQGTKYLISQGASLVSSGQEIVAELEKVVTIPSS